MKNYLELVKVSAKVRKKQSFMTRFCIFLSVFLVSVIFGMADMEVRNEKQQAIQSDGAWHACFRGLTDEEASLISKRPDVKKTAAYAVTNYKLDKDYFVEGKKSVICGFDRGFMDLYPAIEIKEGHFPEKPDEAVVSENMKEQLRLKTGDKITLRTPEGGLEYTVSGITGDTSMIMKWDVFGIFLNTEGYRASFMKETETKDMEYYVQFQPFVNIQKSIKNICESFSLPENRVGENAKLLGLMLQSDDTYMLQLYISAVVLAALVSAAGIFMITGSLNSSVARQTEFFGMLRCLGATGKQVRKFVRREALNWCRTAIPAGLLFASFVIWGICALLRFLSPGYFKEMPVLAVSIPGLLAGAAIGLLTVLLSAYAPAKRASEVSPLTAVSGNAGTVNEIKKPAGKGCFPVEISLGIHHAKGSRKNLFLMTVSFGFSIVLFLAFGTTVDFMNHAIRPLQPDAPDISVFGENNTPSLPKELAGIVREIPGVKNVSGEGMEEGKYTVLNIQLEKKASNETVEKIREAAGEKVLFSDKRMSNEEAKGAYYSFAVLVYGFLVVISLIAVFHIINSISMSAASRMRQFGAMRAIGMSDRQAVRMVAAEAATYGVCGIAAGLLGGIPVHKFLFETLITSKWGDSWEFPFVQTGIIAAVLIVSVALAVAGPAGRIRKMSITDTIGSL